MACRARGLLQKHRTLDTYTLEKSLSAAAGVFTQQERHSEQNGIDSLLQAAAQGNVEKLKLVLASGIDIYAQDNRGRNVGTLAIEKDHSAILEILLKAKIHLCPFKRITLHKSLLSTAVQSGQMVMIELLVNYGADLNEITMFGRDVLVDAITLEHLAATQFLLDKGARMTSLKSLWDTFLQPLERNQAQCLECIWALVSQPQEHFIHR